MAGQYRCANQNRRDQVEKTLNSVGSPVLNGIDFLEVSPDQCTLEIHFIHSLARVSTATTLLETNFLITGGARIKHFEFESLSRGNKTITLKVEEPGDYSNYLLRLVAGPNKDETPVGFDPQLSEIAFSFKLDCRSDFDCKPEDDCPPENLPAPLIDYLAKDYASFRQLMLDRLSTTMPDWKERNAADVQIALVEAVAYQADHLSYYQDAVATEAYLGTARQRISMRRHARLLDYPMHDGCNARAWIHFYVEKGGSADGQALPAHTPLLTSGPTEASVVALQDFDKVLNEEDPIVFETMHAIKLNSNHNEIKFYTWDNTECCLPKGATRATLFNTPLLALQVGDVLIFEEVISPETGMPGDADLSHRQAIRLTEVIAELNGAPLVDPLHAIPIVNIAWEVADALQFSMCISAMVQAENGKLLKENLSIALGNIVLADHGRTIYDETIGEIKENSIGRLSQPLLQRSLITQQGIARDRFGDALHSGSELATFDKNEPASSALRWDVHHTRSAIKLIENGDLGRPWHPRQDLLSSHRFDRVFCVEVDNDGRSRLRFGEGFHGAKPKPDSAFVATYRVGNGLGGNVGAGAIRRIVSSIGGVRLRNPLAASGGLQAESIEQVRQYAPQAFRIQERAVTSADYAEVTERHPDIQKAAATLRWTGSWNTVFVTPDRAEGAPIDTTFENELRTFIERFRMAGEDVELDSPRYVPLEIVFTVCVKPGYYRGQVKANLLEIFGSRDLPDGRRGFFRPDNFTFGQPVYLSRMVALIMQVPGVEWVDAEDAPNKENRFRRWGKAANGEFEAGKIAFAKLEIAQLENDPSWPENGKIDFIMKGGL